MPAIELPNPEEIKEKRSDRFNTWVALTVAVYAIALAIAALGGNNTGKDMLMTQQEASNKWSYYQAKAGREHNCKLAKLRLEVDLAERGAAMATDAKKKADELLKEFVKEEQRYGKEKKEIEGEAHELVKKLKVCIRKDPYFDFAVILLEVAIVAASVSMVAASRSLFGLSLVLALVGVLLTINGFGLFFAMPLLDG